MMRPIEKKQKENWENKKFYQDMVAVFFLMRLNAEDDERGFILGREFSCGFFLYPTYLPRNIFLERKEEEKRQCARKRKERERIDELLETGFLRESH